MTEPTAAARALLARLRAPVADDASPEAVAAALAEREGGTGDRTLDKEIRRELYRLAQRGITVPARTRPPPSDALLGGAIEAWISAVDGRGDRLVWLVRELASGLLLIAADVNEPAGLRDLRAHDVTRKQLRRMRERFQTEGALRFAAADWRAVDALVLEAQDRLGPDADRRLDYRRLRPRLTTSAPRPMAELTSARLSLSPPTPEENAAFVASSATLLREPELRTWWPRPDAIAPWLDEIRGIRESPIVVAPVQQEERLRVVVARATAALFPPDVTARRLRATAYVLAETGRVDAGRLALAVATRLETRPADDVPFLQALVSQALGTYLAASEAKRREERTGALVVTPDEATAGSRGRPPRPRG